MLSGNGRIKFVHVCTGDIRFKTDKNEFPLLKMLVASGGLHFLAVTMQYLFIQKLSVKPGLVTVKGAGNFTLNYIFGLNQDNNYEEGTMPLP